MKYNDCKSSLDTPKKILKVNHAGEFGAINIYRSQIFMSKLFMNDLVPVLEGFLSDEKRHMANFWEEIVRRNGIKCKSFWLCGTGGFVMGIISSFMGRKGILACTWAVESVVIKHLENQLEYLSTKNDKEAYEVVNSILEDEKNHRNFGLPASAGNNIFYSPLRWCISFFTEVTIRFGMR